MIVTCESCKSRYKLDDAKITGRGAKITCPKCKAVFVVYAQPQASQVPEPKAPERRVEVPSSPGASDARWDDEPTRVGETLAPPEPSQSSSVPVEAPRAPPPEPKVEIPKDPGQTAARAAALDFRKVGVTTWKVKVKIGLIYDFSDIKTLRKYIQDGRVTSTDVVSWDGKSWRAIGDIPDLDAFFVSTWDMLAERRESAPEAAPVVHPPSPPNEEAVRPNGGDPATSRTGGEATQFQDPFAESRRRQKEKAERNRTSPVQLAGRPAAPPSRVPLLLGILLVLAFLGGGGWWWSTRQTEVPKTPAPSLTAPASGSAADDIKKKIEGDIQARLQENPASTSSTPAPAAPKGPDGPRSGELSPRIPAGAGVPEGAVARVPKATPNGSPTIRQSDQTAGDHEAVGDDAAGGGDWSTAAQAYQQAVSLDAKSGRLRGKLGRAQFEAGDLAAAQGTLQKASQMGVKDAHKYLGHIARTQGDLPGATYEYQEYLKGTPKDSDEIEKILSKMNGG